MAKVKLSFTSIPLDAIYQILHTIDNKPDLDNLCLAFPCIGEIVAENTHIVKQLYWKEIQNDFFMPLALLNSTLNKSDEASQLLQSLVPPKHSEDDDDETGTEDSNIQLTPAALVKTLSPQTTFNMTIIHMQIEKLAYIFMKTQLESHYPPPQIYRSPTCGERMRVIMAVYRAHIMVAMRFVNHPKFPISSSTYNTYLEISEKMIPHIQQEVFYILWDQWNYWDFKEVGVVLDKLWSELPMAVYREALGKGLDVDSDLFEVLHRRIRRKAGPSTILVQSRTSRLTDVFTKDEINDTASVEPGALDRFHPPDQPKHSSDPSSTGREENLTVKMATVAKTGKVTFEDSSPEVFIR
ncbi:hypothetical protein TWF679_002679 [Orbilia oligospora]|uniref:Uncharacterized protein n=1 Tax=Orbilia oligospora TaxID=2813651 RepID=A0A8H8VG00_ORBOL|nr:hypothetical protein TWF679_002679 [Orbilia oligospora]